MTIRARISGRGRLSHTRDRVLSDVRQQLQSGQPSAAVAVTKSEVGAPLGVAVSMLCSELEYAGFRVVRASNPGSSDRSDIVVRAA